MEVGNQPQVVEETTVMDELLKAEELLDAGLLTDEEFAKLKEKLLK